MADQELSVASSPAPPGEEAIRRTTRGREVASALVALLAFATLTYLAHTMELRREVGGIDPRWWPRALGLAGTALAAVLLLRSLVRPVGFAGDAQPATREGAVRVAATVGLAVAYVLLWSAVDFALVTVVLLAVTTALFGGRGWRALLLYPVLLTGAVYLLFQTFLRVPL